MSTWVNLLPLIIIAVVIGWLSIIVSLLLELHRLCVHVPSDP